MGGGMGGLKDQGRSWPTTGTGKFALNTLMTIWLWIKSLLLTHNEGPALPVCHPHHHRGGWWRIWGSSSRLQKDHCIGLSCSAVGC